MGTALFRASFILPGAMLVALSAGPAAAFERSRDPYTGVCLWAERRTVTFVINQSCRIGGSHESCRGAVESALELWNDSGCSDVRLVLGGSIPASKVACDLDHPENNVNLILVENSRTAPRAAHPKAREHETNLSIVTYDRVGGKIIDTDIDLDNQTLSADELHNIVAHEAGHALGLAHSRDPAAVMYRVSGTEGRRDRLAPDDLAALCTLYPAGRPTPPCAQENPVYAQSTRRTGNLDEDPEGAAGCETVGSQTIYATLFIAAGCLFLAIRKRSGAPTPGGRILP